MSFKQENAWNLGKLTMWGKQRCLQNHEEVRPTSRKSTKKCYEMVNEIERERIVKFINQMRSNDKINLYLIGFVLVLPVQGRLVEDLSLIHI